MTSKFYMTYMTPEAESRSYCDNNVNSCSLLMLIRLLK